MALQCMRLSYPKASQRYEDVTTGDMRSVTAALVFELIRSHTKRLSAHVWALHQKHPSGDPHNGAHQSLHQARRGFASQKPIVHHCPRFISTSIEDISMTGYNSLDLPFHYSLRIASHQSVVNGRNVVNEAFRPYRSRVCALRKFARERTLVRRARTILLTEGQRPMWRTRPVIARHTSVHGRFIIRSVHGRFIIRSDCISVFVGL